MSLTPALRRALVVVALAAGLTSVGLPADAAPAPVAGSSCLPTGAAVRTFTGAGGNDGMEMSRATAAAVDRAVRSRANVRASHRAADGLPGSITIPVRAHIILGTHKRDRHVTVAAIRAQIAVLNQAYSGQEAVGRTPDANTTPTADTSFRFRLRGVTKTKNDAWFHISRPGGVANAMKKHLHQGKAFTLNIYFVQPSLRSGLLGYATFPYQYRRQPQLDGLVVNIQSLPGGSLTHYNLGNTAVHEIGHWLGLRHVFNDQATGSVEAPDPGDCVDNDGLADTPVQAYPTTGCPVGKDTCTDPGLDSIHDFMDYSWDECMYQFTPDQAAYMALSWSRYRAP